MRSGLLLLLLLPLWIIHAAFSFPGIISPIGRLDPLETSGRDAPRKNLLAVPIANKTCGICGTNYTAGIGETLESIAAYCGISTREAADANPGLPSTNLTGLLLQIPCNGKDPARCGICGAWYTVKKQDTLFDIAHSCGMNLLELELANQDTDWENIIDGEIIRVPCEADNGNITLSACGVCGMKYTVTMNGESLAQVAVDCGVSVLELSQANPRLSSMLIEGQQLRIPCNSTTKSSNASCGPCGNSLTVSDEGQVLGVALKCRVGLIDLEQLNPSTFWDTLKPGQRLKIPCTRQLSPGECGHHLCDTTIVVKNTSKVSEIAKLCNVTPALISYANDLSVTALVNSGQTLAVPCVESPTALRGCSICGSTLAPSVAVDLITVARGCDATVQEIQQASNTNLTSVAVGDVLTIPCNNREVNCGPCGVAYKAKDDETLPSIAVKCSTMISDIRKANTAINFSDSIAGKLITIPCSSSTESFGCPKLTIPRKLHLALLLLAFL